MLSSRETASESLRKVVSDKHSIYTHFANDRNCDICMKNKITRTLCRKRMGAAILRACRDPLPASSVTNFYLQYSSVMSCMRTESGKETLWSQTLRSWKRWIRNPCLETQCKGSANAQNFYITHRRWNSQIIWRRSGSENIHVGTGQP